MKIKVEREVTLGELLHELLQGTGIAMTKTVGPREVEVSISASDLEPVAEAFAAAVRQHALCEGNKPPFQGG